MDNTQSNFTQEDAEKLMTKANEITIERRKKEEEDTRKLIRGSYYQIIEILKEYTDLDEDYYKIISLWIIGTYVHEKFPTYPYLFLNAMKGSGKTRVLNLIASLAHGGKVLLSPTEAIMFRIPKGHTICIDELEGIMRKENAGLREMLNACYKKGSTVFRMKQKKVDGSTEQVVEEFEPYKPVCMANINGMENVLEDRCLTLTLERSERYDIMRLVEDFNENSIIKAIKSGFEANLVQLCSVVYSRGNLKQWNNHVKFTSNLYTQTTLNTQTTPESDTLDFFNKVLDSGIKGRNLELFLPLFFISQQISDSVVSEVIKIAKKISENKEKSDEFESKDKMLYDFVSRQEESFEYKKIKLLLIAFRNFVGNLEDDEKWLNEKWLGKALSRLKLVRDKRRLSGGMEVTLDIEKAKQKIEMFNSQQRTREEDMNAK